MSEQTLKEWITILTKATETIFNVQHHLTPRYLIETKHNELLFVVPPDDKDLGIMVMRELLKSGIARRYCFIDEAWLLNRIFDKQYKDGISLEETQKIEREGLRNHPDRIEGVIYSAEDSDCQVIAQQVITRPKKGYPSLGPLEFKIMPSQRGYTMGRMVGLMPAEGRRQ
jgi:hypothetical protein